jgi:hexulose-6-phosphate isomerase
VVIFGYPQDWIRTLGKRIAKIHLKDFKRNGSQWKQIREGDVQWPEVRKALAEVGYDGWLTTEVAGGNEAYLRDLASRVDKIIAGV